MCRRRGADHVAAPVYPRNMTARGLGFVRFSINLLRFVFPKLTIANVHRAKGRCRR